MSEVFATLSTSLNQRAPADIPLERKRHDLHGAGIFRRPAVFDYSWTTRDASASWRLQGTLRGNLRAVRFSALWCALLPTLERRYRFTASADVCDRGASPCSPYVQGFQDAGPHPHAQGAGEATTCGVLISSPEYHGGKTQGRTRTPRALEQQRPAAIPHYNKSRRDIRDGAGCDVASLTVAGCRR